MIRKSVAPVWAALGSMLILLVAGEAPSPRAAEGPLVRAALGGRAARDGRVRVIVELNPRSGRHVPEGRLSSLASSAQRTEIRAAAARVISTLRFGVRDVVHRFDTVPYLVLELDADGLAAIENSSGDIVQVMDDSILKPTLADSVPLIQGDQAWAAGHRGSGTTIAVLDTGVDSAHPFLTGKMAEEACYSSTVAGLSQSVCPSGLTSQIGPGSATPCALPECLHGTHVAGIAAGNGVSAGVPFSGVAPDAQLMAVQVFSEITDPISCGGSAPCMGAFTSDIIAGLERVYAVAPALNVVSVNMSLGGNTFAAPCDNQPYKAAIDNLRSIGVATVVASGNSSATSGISTPACISSAISVGSTDKSNHVSWFSNVASFLSLFAPGESITSSIPGGTFRSLSGTSMAAPHVAGTWGLLREAVPGASVGTILNALRQTGLPIAVERQRPGDNGRERGDDSGDDSCHRPGSHRDRGCHRLYAHAGRRHIIGPDVHDRSAGDAGGEPIDGRTRNHRHGHTREWIRRRAGLDRAGGDGRAEYKQRGVDLCRRQHDDPGVERRDADDGRHVRVPPVS